MFRNRPTISVLNTAVAFACIAISLFGCRRFPPPFRNLFQRDHHNLIVICLDTLRSDFVGAYGNASAHSPNIDRLSRNGVLFSDATTPAPWTYPAHVSLFTGLLPGEHGVLSLHHRIPESVPMLAEILQNRGYNTGAFTGSGALIPDFGFDRGFECFEYGHFHLKDHLPAAVDWLEMQADEQPFFLFLHGYDMHAPWYHRDPFSSAFVDAFPSKNIDPRAITIDMYREGHHDLAYSLSHYNFMLLETDRIIGTLLAVLETTGLAGNTSIVLLSDHGEELMDHGAFEHRFLNLYQATIAVPLIISGPDIVRNHVVSDPRNLLDVFMWIKAGFANDVVFPGGNTTGLFCETGAPDNRIISENQSFQNLLLNHHYERFNQSWYIRAAVLSSRIYTEPLLTAIEEECRQCPDLITEIGPDKYRIDFGLYKCVVQFCENNPFEAGVLFLERIGPMEMDTFEDTLYASLGCRDCTRDTGFEDWDRIEFGNYVCYMPEGYEITSYYNSACVRNREWKYMYDEGTGMKWLFNLENDPAERVNLAEQCPGIAEEMHAFLIKSYTSGEMITHDSDVFLEQDPQIIEQLKALGYIH